MSTGVVLDASAVLAWLRAEPGADQVDTALDGSALSTVNASEIAQKLLQHGTDGTWAIAELRDLGVVLTPFMDADAMVAADLWASTRAAGLSLGDRACLAVAHRLSKPALTGDQAWKGLDLGGIEVQLIR